MPEGDNPLGHSFNDGTIRFYFAFAGICTAGCFTAGSFFGTRKQKDGGSQEIFAKE